MSPNPCEQVCLGRRAGGWAGVLMPLVLTDAQPKKVRKVPPGLPSSVSWGTEGPTGQVLLVSPTGVGSAGLLP